MNNAQSFRRCRTSHSRPRGFTLIEVLAVIAIVAVLAAILIPVVGAVRTSARKAQGVSNLRQLHVAFISHANDQKGQLPLGGGRVTNGRNGLSWVNRLLPYVGRPELAEVSLNESWDAPPSPVFQDPGVAEPGEQDRIYAATTDAIWGFGYNIQPLLPESPVYLADWSDGEPPRIRLDAVTHHSRRMLVGSAFDWFVNGAEENRAYHRYGRDRALCLFFDGHVSTVTRAGYDAAWRSPTGG